MLMTVALLFLFLLRLWMLQHISVWRTFPQLVKPRKSSVANQKGNGVICFLFWFCVRRIACLTLRTEMCTCRPMSTASACSALWSMKDSSTWRRRTLSSRSPWANREVCLCPKLLSLDTIFLNEQLRKKLSIYVHQSLKPIRADITQI